jgi:hypothetical protein
MFLPSRPSWPSWLKSSHHEEHEAHEVRIIIAPRRQGRKGESALHVEDHPRMPAFVLFPHSQPVVRDTLDLGVKTMALEIEDLSFDSTIHAAGLDIYHLATFADKSFEIEFRQQLGEPGLQEIFPAFAARGNRDFLFDLDSVGTGDQGIQRLGGGGKKLCRVLGLDFDADVGGVVDLAEAVVSVSRGRTPLRAG